MIKLSHRICLFLLLILMFSLYLGTRPLIETNTNYNDYDKNSAILSEKNAANVQYLKEQLGQFGDIKKSMEILKKDVAENTYNIKQISQIATKHSQDLLKK